MAVAGARAPRQRVDGVLLLDKPAGISSNAALQRARRALNALKAGHTGTLDPLASGLLPLCFGEATKFARFLLDADKRYTATVRFGTATNTGDAEGQVVASAPFALDDGRIEAALRGFLGAQLQVPPAFSALKHEGRKLYDYARAGIDVPRAAREIRVEALRLLEWRAPDAVLDVVCSKGTYVRALAADLGAALGTVAHLAALRRESTGGYSVEAAVTLDALEAIAPAERHALLRPIDCLVETLPRVDLDATAARRLRTGQAIPAAPGDSPEPCRAYDASGRLIGVVVYDNGIWRPERMLAERAETRHLGR